MEEEMLLTTGKAWHELRWLAQDRQSWLGSFAALCSTGSQENQVSKC